MRYEADVLQIYGGKMNEKKTPLMFSAVSGSPQVLYDTTPHSASISPAFHIITLPASSDIRHNPANIRHLTSNM